MNLPIPISGTFASIVLACIFVLFTRLSPLKISSKFPWWIGAWDIAYPSGLFDIHIPTAEELEIDVSKIYPLVDKLRRQNFFSLYKTELEGDCPFWAAQAICSSPDQACTVCRCLDRDIPTPFKERPNETYRNRKNRMNKAEMTKWENPKFTTPFGAEEPDKDDQVYVDLRINRPANTGYKGGAVWQMMFRENCMGHKEDPLENDAPDSLALAERCTEELTFWRIISGMVQSVALLNSENFHVQYRPPSNATSQASSSDIQIDKDTDYESALINEEIERALRRSYSPDVDFFRFRVAPFRERLENVYFTFSVLVRAICRMASVLEEVTCDTGNPPVDLAARANLMQLVNTSIWDSYSCKSAYLSQPLFDRKFSLADRQLNNITRLLDCVECQKCRLHGIVTIEAFLLTLKSAGRASEVDHLDRNGVVALVNTLGYFAESIDILHRMETRRNYGAISFICFWGLIGFCLSTCIWVYKRTGKSKPAHKVHSE